MKENEDDLLPLLKRETEAIHELYEYIPKKEIKFDNYPEFTETKDEIVSDATGYEKYWAFTCPYCKRDLGRTTQDVDELEIEVEKKNDKILWKCNFCNRLIDSTESEIIELPKKPDSNITTEDQWFVYTLRHKHKKPYKIIAKLKQTSESNVRDLFMKAKRNINKYLQSVKEHKETDLFKVYSDFEIETALKHDSLLQFDFPIQHDVLLMQKYDERGSVDLIFGKAEISRNCNTTPFGDVVIRFRLPKDKLLEGEKELDVLFVYTKRKGWNSFPLTDVGE